MKLFEIPFDQHKLPSLPALSLRLRHLLDQNRPSIREIIQTILSDPALAFRVLTLLTASTSVKYAAPTATITRVIKSLGIKPIRDIFGSLAIFQDSNDLRLKSGFDLYAFWKHSVFTALAAEAIAAEMPRINPEEAYLSGLLHDIGKLAIARFAPTANKKLEKIQNSLDLPLQTEEKVLQTNHLEIGAAIAKHVLFPPMLIDVIRNHHLNTVNTIRASLKHQMIAVVHTARSISQTFYNRETAMHHFFEGRERAEHLLRLSTGQFNTIIRNVSNKIYGILDQIHVSAEIFQSYGQRLEDVVKEAERLRAELERNAELQQKATLKAQLLEDLLTFVAHRASREELLQRLIKTIFVNTNFNHIVLFLYDDRQELLQVKLHFGLEPNDRLRWAKLDPKSEEGVIVSSFLSGETINVANYDEAELNGTYSQEELSYVKAYPFCAIPIRSATHPIGVVYFSHGREMIVVQQDIIDILQDVFERASLFLN